MSVICIIVCLLSVTMVLIGYSVFWLFGVCLSAQFFVWSDLFLTSPVYVETDVKQCLLGNSINLSIGLHKPHPTAVVA